ncbi:MAG: helix-turn-helix domain-containing protein [Gammaproteobacteria bacterium]
MEAGIGPGQQLRAEREALGVTVREVADTLNLSMVVIQALEEDDYDRLPGVVFTRGYVRAYARLLDIDPAPLLQRLPAAGSTFETPGTATESSVAEWIRRRPALVLSALGGVAVAVVIGLAVLLWPQDGIESLWRAVDSPDVAVPPVEADAAWEWEQAQQSGLVPDGADNIPPTDAERAVAGGDGSADPGSSAVDSADGRPDERADASTDTAASEVLPLAANGIRRLTPAGEQTLALQFGGDCWVEIRDAAGTVLYRELGQAGERRDFVGQGPFRLLLGHAPSVSVTFAGETVALAPHTRNNVATLVLGQ